MAENHKQGTMEKRAITQVQPEEKQSTLSLTMIWVGGVISAPALMVGAILMGGFSKNHCQWIACIGCFNSV